jgi:hypothetical protein
MVSTACSVALTAVDVFLGDRGKRQAGPQSARSGLRLVHEGFDTLDLKDAKALLEGLA